MRKLITSTILACLASPAGAFQVQNGQVYDHQNQEVAIYGVNWFGFETSDHIVHGLWSRNWQEMIQQIKSLGFTAVRLPVCPGTLKGESPNSIDYGKNPDLKDLNALQILDKMVAEFDRQGIYLLLDHHRPDCQAISNLWYTDSYSEQAWIDDLVFMAKRYRDTPHLLGIDLKNEPHGNVTWGTNEAATDWRLAAQRAATAIMAENENVLMFVEGVQENPVCSGTTNHWWGGNLEPVRCFPSEIPKERLVYSPHVYGPDVFGQTYFDDATFPQNMTAIWDGHFGYLVNEGYAVIFGEFGGKYGHGGNAKDKIWQDALVDYMLAKGITNFFYWSWNPNSGDTGGILQDDWTKVWDDKVALLNRLMTGTTVTPTTPTTPPVIEPTTPTTPTTPPVTESTSTTTTPPASSGSTSTLVNSGGCQVTYTVDSQWEDGMVLRFLLNNQNVAPIDGWQVQWTFPQPAVIVNFWNVGLDVNGNTVTVTNEDWNKTVYTNSPVEFGMQLQGTHLQPPTTATLFSSACGSSPLPTSATTGESNQESYQAGYQAGIAHCQQDPAACGIQVNTNANTSETEFQLDTGLLLLPKVTIVETQGKSDWEAAMEYIDSNLCPLLQDAILFKVTAVKPLVTVDR